ncbi:MAG TPA: PepSY-associated TM helix domain-containing protein, partial [Acidobacteriota bacterium]|nr:PepSY-associated TM helix domain-containing protein [Acidobacteriota bacterium]
MSADPVNLAPEKRLRRWHTWLVVWRVHRWLGFVAGALIVLLSATGSLLVVHHELEAWLERDRRF